MLISDAANLTNEVATEHVAVDVKTEARRLIGEGRSVVPIPKGEKGPQILKWQDLRLKADEVDGYFRGNNRNIGVILGKPSGGLADVDLDCDEAVRLAPKYLPPTGCITGRTGQPDRHWWYISKDCETARHRDKLCKGEGATVVELRSTGHQTVVGPSIHPDGSQYDNLEGEPTVVDAEVLTAAVEALYQAVLKERGHEGQGETTAANPKPVSVPSPVVADGSTQRPGDDYNQRATQSSMVSYLQSQGFTQDGTSEHGIRLRRPGKDDGCSLAVCLNGAVVNWSTSLPLDVSEHGAPKPMAPFHVYAQLEHDGDYSAAGRALRAQGYGNDDCGGVDSSGILNGQNISVTSMGGDPDSDEIPEAKIPVNPEFPPHLLKVPGFVGQVTQYMLSTAKRPQPVLSLWAALCLQAVLCGRKIRDPFGGGTRTHSVR
ncbi:MAG: bifunctional DNA primase/polymerase [Planctomycetaceae bacterium]|nr:bifunctional DNA primase/polymerase [Planctomycetaceae bacterium]